MKPTKAPSRLTASDEDVARLFDALDDEVPSRSVETAILARIDAAAAGATGAGRRAPERAFFRKAAIVGGLLVVGLLAMYAFRGAPHVDVHVQPAVTASRDIELPKTVGDHGGEPLTSGTAIEDLPTVQFPRVPRAASATAREEKDSFREQLAIVEKARHSLAQRKTEDCLATLELYDRKFPSGVFTTEVRVVRIEALKATGRVDEARALARALLASDPRGPYADRLRSVFPKLDGNDQ